MKTIKIEIVSDDRNYADALARSLSHISGIYSVSIRDCNEFLVQWRKKGSALRKEMDIILWDGVEGEKICSDNIIWIREKEDIPTDSALTGGFSIFRYDTASMIHRRLIDIYRKLTGQSLPEGGSGDTRVLSFLSWQGGSGCSTVCCAVGQELTRFYGKRILILSLDSAGYQPPGVQVYDSAFSVDAFLYRLFHRPDDMNMEQFILQDAYGVFHMVPSLGRNPLQDLSKEEAGAVMKRLMQAGSFDGVLIDGGNSTSDGAGAFIAFAEKICSVERRPQRPREKRYMSWLGNIIDGSVPILPVKSGDAAEAGLSEQAKNTRGSSKKTDRDRIKYLRERDDELSEMLLEGDFGSDIHELTEMLWYNNNK